MTSAQVSISHAEDLIGARWAWFPKARVGSLLQNSRAHRVSPAATAQSIYCPRPQLPSASVKCRPLPLGWLGSKKTGLRQLILSPGVVRTTPGAATRPQGG